MSQYSIALAPFIPFMTEEIYTNLTGEKSVHLADWPEWEKMCEKWLNKELEKQMDDGIDVASKINMMRKTSQVPVRIPLRKVSYQGPSELNAEILPIVLDEVNVYELSYDGKAEEFSLVGEVAKIIDVSNQDVAAGEAREIVRRIQAERKNLGTALDEKVDVELPTWPEKFESEIKRKALVENLSKGEEFKVIRRS